MDLVIKNPFYDKWEFNINEEIRGRGSAVLNVESLSILRDIRDCLPEFREKYKQNLTDLMRRFLAANLIPAVSKVYRNYHEYREYFVSGGGIIEALGNGESILVGVLCEIKPDGKFVYHVSYEIILTTHGQELGYLCPQVHVPEKVAKQVGKKICKKLYEANVIGFVTVQLCVFSKAKKQLKIAVKNIEPYYTEF